MQNPWVTRSALMALSLVVVAQALWMLATRENRPSLDRVITTTAIGQNSAVYEVLSDSAGATVGMTYFYFVHEKVDDESQLLTRLDPRSAFLVTRQSKAVIAVNGTQIQARTHDTVYRYSSLAILHEGEQAIPVTVELDSKMDQATPHAP
ncbi:hypothetical protein [Pseudomonas sp. NPDC089406]|uniref:hypothetical protein n=1 Tax=Pseudomonas sp. NPDC089406 TaxID=3364463 RepID=UPI00384B7B89